MPLSKYLRNKLHDRLHRGQSYTFPTNLYIGALTALPTDTTDGTEAAGGNYARATIPATMTDMSGTQGAGTTSASSGSSGEISNNDDVVMVASLTVAINGVVAVGVYDALTGGNLLEWDEIVNSLDEPITRNFGVGDEMSFSPGQIRIKIV